MKRIKLNVRLNMFKCQLGPKLFLVSPANTDFIGTRFLCDGLQSLGTKPSIKTGCLDDKGDYWSYRTVPHCQTHIKPTRWRPKESPNVQGAEGQRKAAIRKLEKTSF